jgi:hypothetical protein
MVPWRKDRKVVHGLDSKHSLVVNAGVAPQRFALDLMHLGARR